MQIPIEDNFAFRGSKVADDLPKIHDCSDFVFEICGRYKVLIVQLNQSYLVCSQSPDYKVEIMDESARNICSV